MFHMIYDKKQEAWKQAFPLEIYFGSEEERDRFEKAMMEGKLEPARPHGEWVPDDYGYNHCSCCGYEHDEPECVTHYCPNCGADMDQEDEDDS